MNVHFFEEFPSEQNLEKVKLISFPSTIYVAAKSISEFNIIRADIENANPMIEVGYWPILEKSYWISPFSYSSELEMLYHDLNNNRMNKSTKILLDLELPLLKPRLLIINLFAFRKNKRMIQQFFMDSEKLNIELMTAEYPGFNSMTQNVMEWLGISYNMARYEHKKIIMLYTSVIRNKALQSMIRRHIIRSSKRMNGRLQVGLGTISFGIFGREPILEPEGLCNELAFCKSNGIQSVVIFRLGGLNGKYIDQIENNM
jgi:hypothetical protein